MTQSNGLANEPKKEIIENVSAGIICIKKLLSLLDEHMKKQISVGTLIKRRNLAIHRIINQKHGFEIAFFDKRIFP